MRSSDQVPTSDLQNTNADLLDEAPDVEDRVQGPAFVRNIPKAMWNKRGEALKFYLQSEISKARAERSGFVQKIVRWRKAYNAPKPESAKNYPIANASNLTIPIIKEAVNTIIPQIVQSVFAPTEHHWVLENLSDEWSAYINDIQKFLDIAAKRDFDLAKVGIDAVVEQVKLGTVIFEVPWKVDARKVYQYTADGTSVYPVKKVLKDGPSPKTIPLEHFWIRNNQTDLHEAPWCGKKVRLTEDEVRRRIKTGEFDHEAGERILALLEDYRTDEGSEVEEEKREKTKPIDFEGFEFFVLHVSFDIDDDGQKEELFVYFHEATGTFPVRQFNSNWLLRRPYESAVYFPVEHRFYGEGLVEMLEQLQDGISMTTNRRMDNASMANAKMILKRATVRNLKPGDPLYSGKLIEVNDIWNDMREFQLADIYPSTVQEEMIMRGNVDRISGLSEGSRGAGTPVSRTTATAQLALLQESKNRIDIPIRSMRRAKSLIGMQVIALYYQHGVNGKALAWLGERGAVVEAMFRLPRRVLELGFAIRAHSPTSVQNMQVKRENALALFNLTVQLYERLVPLVGQIVPESATEIVRGLVESAHRFMGDVLAGFETSNPEEVLHGLVTLKRLLPAAEDFGGLASEQKREEIAENIANLSRLEGILEEAESTARGYDGLLPSGADPGGISLPQGVSGGVSQVPEFSGGPPGTAINRFMADSFGG